MPSRWRRKYSALYDNVLEGRLTDGQLATAVRLQALLHRAWRTDPVRYETSGSGEADKVLTQAELYEVTRVRSPSKARTKLLALSGCDPYQLGPLRVELCTESGHPLAQADPPPDPGVGAQTVRVIWSNFGQIINAHGPRVAAPRGPPWPHEGRSTKYDEEKRRASPGGRRRGGDNAVVRGQVATEGWDPPLNTPRLADWTEDQRAAAKKQSEALRERLRRRKKIGR